MPDRDERDRDEREERPHFGNLHERIETLKRIPADDAVEYLKTIIESAFREGFIEGEERMCHCAATIVRATCCCRRREDEDRDRDEFGDRDDDRGRDDDDREKRRRR